MEAELFRSEVIAARGSAEFGCINITTSTSQKLVAAAVFVLLVSCVAVLFLGRYSRTITVDGELVRLQQRVPLVAERAAMVCRTQVKAGQEVKRGVPLVALAPSSADCATSVTILRAPITGTVVGPLPVNGSPATPHQRLLVIARDITTVRALLLVPGSALTHISGGDRVVLQVDAFPYRKFGLQLGHIASIGDQPQRPAGRTRSSAFYEVQVTLDRRSVRAYGRDVPLRPGMTVRANLQLETRRLIEWLFEPLYTRRVNAQGAKQ